MAYADPRLMLFIVTWPPIACRLGRRWVYYAGELYP